MFNGPAGGEINATGKIVYGYNLRVTTAGTYRITYTMPQRHLHGCDAGTCDGNTASSTSRWAVAVAVAAARRWRQGGGAGQGSN